MKSSKIGRRVKIINPEFLDRCGYNETLETATEKFKETFKAKYEEPVSLFLKKSFPFLSFKEHEINTIISQLAKSYNRTILKFGGKERKLFTKVISEYKNLECSIEAGPKTHITGTYSPGHSHSYFDEYDWEPPSLYNRKTHVFYEVSIIGKSFPHIEKTFPLNGMKLYWVEKTNLEFID
tara:strand:- start:20544 stop:21083 length:540 start_codon:yes stop_codon:yes gene_type:complete